MLQRLRQNLFHNVGIKIASLVLAMAVYLHVYSIQDRTTILQIPLSVEGIPRGLAYRGEVPSHVRVRLRGSGGELLKLRAEPVRAVVRLTQPRVGELQRPVTTADVELPAEAAVLVEALVEPVTLALSIEPIASAVRPVAVRFRGLPSEGFVRYGAIRVFPETLRVSGPAGLIAHLDSIPTEEIDLNDRSETVGESVRLRLAEGVECRSDHVSVRVPIVPLLRRSFGPLRVSLPPEFRSNWSIDPESVRVRLVGPKPLLETLSGQDLRPRAVPSLPVGSEDVAPVQAGIPRP